MSEIIWNPYNVYLSWAVYAVAGRLREADAILRKRGPAVREVAAALRRRFPVEPRTLYRGVLLIDEDAAPGAIGAQPGVQSTSFTEDIDCARWFACPEASVSGAVVEEKGASVRGYLLEYAPAPGEILFHHTWRVLGPNVPDGGFVDLFHAAVYAEHVGALPETGACQVAWALRTQSEVIVEALRGPIPVRPVGPLDAAALEARYGPPALVYVITGIQRGGPAAQAHVP